MNTLTILFFDGKDAIWIVVGILILFGGSKIPELMKGLGTGIKEFKKATKDEENTTSEEKKDEVK